MDERNTVFGKEQIRMESTLSYIVGGELLRPMDEMDTALVEKSIRAIQQIDKNAVPSDSQFETALETIHSYSEKTDSKEINIPDPMISDNNVKTHKKLSNKVKIIIIAAIISALIAGITVYAFTDIFSLFFNNPRDILEWKDGESRRIGNYEMIISSELQQFDSIEELKSVVNVPIICPEGNSEDITITGIYYKPLKSDPVVYIDCTFNNVPINFAIHINSNSPSQEEINSYQYDRFKTINNNLFFIMESEIGYQCLSRIDDNVYIISSSNKDDIIHFIKNVKEL